MKEPTVWGIHAGRTGDADSLFLKNNVVAVGWEEMGDLSKIACDRGPYKLAVSKAYPECETWCGSELCRSTPALCL